MKPKPPRRPVVIRFVPAPADWSMRPALDVIARAAGHRDFEALVDLSLQPRAQP